MRSLLGKVAPPSLLLTSLVTSLVLLGTLSCAAPTPPANPSWDTDVLPIIRGSCGHCHGETFATTAPPNFRLDLCDPTAFAGAPSELVGPLGASGLAAIMLGDINPMTDGSRPKMPPSPAATLSDYEVGVIKNWVGLNGDATARCKKQAANHDPKAVLVGGITKEGSTLKATIEVSDPDGDQVIGTATAGSGSAKIPSVGRREIAISNASGDKITVRLWDGYAGAKEFTLP